MEETPEKCFVPINPESAEKRNFRYFLRRVVPIGDVRAPAMVLDSC